MKRQKSVLKLIMDTVLMMQLCDINEAIFVDRCQHGGRRGQRTSRLGLFGTRQGDFNKNSKVFIEKVLANAAAAKVCRQQMNRK